MDFVLTLHSIVRWLAVLVAVIAVVRFVLVMAGKAQSSGMDRGLMSGYTGLLDSNVLLGLILIIGLGEWEAVQIEHAVTNVIGVVVAHFFAQRAKKIEDPKIKARTNLLGVVISILIIVVGVMFVGGWAR
jgi:hypothetical protein